MCVCVCVCVCVHAHMCGWLGVDKINNWYLRACFILVSLLVFLLCPGRCVPFTVCYTSASDCSRSISLV